MRTRLQMFLGSLVAASLVGGCQDANVTAPNLPPARPTANVSGGQAQVVERPEEALLWSLAQSLPGFGGLYGDEAGGVTVWLTHPMPQVFVEGAVRGALRRHVPGSASRPVNMRIGAYTFDSLAAWRDRLVAPVLEIPGVVSVDLDEERNRVVVGSSDPGAAGQVSKVLSQLAVPRGGVLVFRDEQVDLAGPVEEQGSGASSCDAVAFHICRPLWAGIMVSRRYGGGQDRAWICTLGFAATISGVRVLITASHCSTDMWSLDNTVLNQDRPRFDIDNHRVASEWRDPNAPGCGFLGIANCRYSDASAFRLDDSVSAEGKIARTQAVAVWPATQGSGVIDAANPYWPVKGPASTAVYVGLTVQKVGATTGWTQGAITRTCVDVKTGLLGLGKRFYCQHFVRLGFQGGDSGSPIFSVAGPDGAVFLLGTLFATKGSGSNYESVFSPLGNIATDLGSLTNYWTVYYNPPPPLGVWIAGPTLIETAGSYTWQANATSGTPPYSYHWYVEWLDSGISDELGSGQTQSLYVTAAGNFRLDVIVDAGAETATNFLYVQNEVGGGGGPERPALTGSDAVAGSTTGKMQ